MLRRDTFAAREVGKEGKERGRGYFSLKRGIRPEEWYLGVEGSRYWVLKSFMENGNRRCGLQFSAGEKGMRIELLPGKTGGIGVLERH